MARHPLRYAIYTTVVTVLVVLTILYMTHVRWVSWQMVVGALFVYAALLSIDFLFFSTKELLQDVMTAVLRGLYSKYKNEKWPVMSSIATTPPLLNVAFPDKAIIYYMSSFSSWDTITLSGTIPPNVYFWSMTVYDTTGAPTAYVDDTSFPSGMYTIRLRHWTPQTTEYGIYSLTCPQGSYCVIQRGYVSSTTPPLDPTYLATISGVTTTNVTQQERIDNSTQIEKMLHRAFASKVSGKSLSDMFPGIDTSVFFLPSAAQVSGAFPNPYATYLMVFPGQTGVIRVDGTVGQEAIGMSNPHGLRFVSFMASDLSTTATDDSINMADFKHPSGIGIYTLFAARSTEAATSQGYDPSLHNLLLWAPTTTMPVLIYRLVVAAGGSVIGSLDNSNGPVTGSVAKTAFGTYYPIAQTT